MKSQPLGGGDLKGQEFKAILDYIVNSRLVWVTRNPVSKINEEVNK